MSESREYAVLGDHMNSSDRHQGRTATEAGWHISRYNIAARIPGTKMTVIFNTYRRICAVYTPIELHIMRVLDEVSENHPLIGRLASRGVIANYDEREAFALQRTLSCAHAPVGGVSITICPTLACNFECPYCFATRGRGKMTPEVQDDVVAFAARMLDAANAKELTITWFGGEPLMATDVIEALSPRLIEVAEERGCKYEAWIFTNGHLLSQSVVDLLLRCRVTYVHIPLDGVGVTNDATRRLVGGGPTYQRIVDNLGLLKPPIKTLMPKSSRGILQTCESSASSTSMQEQLETEGWILRPESTFSFRDLPDDYFQITNPAPWTKAFRLDF